MLFRQALLVLDNEAERLVAQLNISYEYAYFEACKGHLTIAEVRRHAESSVHTYKWISDPVSEIPAERKSDSRIVEDSDTP